MAEYCTDEIRSLRNQLEFSPERVRRGQLRRIERVIGELEPDRPVPFGYVHLYVTGHGTESSDPARLLPAEELRRDLLTLLSDLSDGLEIRAAEEGEPVYTLKDAAARCRVSTKTISRWRQMGLPARKFVFPRNGKLLGVTRSSLTGFLRKNREMVLRARGFQRVSTEEADRIIEAARALAREGRSQTEMANLLAEEFGRSHETIRQAIKRHRRDHPEDEDFRRFRGKLSEREKEEVFRKVGEGASASRLAREMGVDRSSLYRAYYDKKAEEELGSQVSYVWSKEFEKPGAEEEVLGAAPKWEMKDLRFSARSLEDYLASFRGVAVLSPEDERALFRKYNYAKYRFAQLRQSLGRDTPKGSILSAIDFYRDMALNAKNALVYSNMRLVMSVARKHAGRFVHMAELVSAGTEALLNAVEKFDYTRGTKFSTYATWVLVRRFAKLVPEENYQLDTFLTGTEELISRTEAEGPSDGWRRSIARLLNRVLGGLPEREQRVITSRYGLKPGQPPQSLREVGEKEGLSKEGVRQLEAKAFEKLRKLLEDESLELPPD